MDATCFDRLARSLVSPQSRRTMLLLTIGSKASGLAAGYADAGNGRKKKRKRKRKPCSCGRCRACQSGVCVPVADGADCGECGFCQGGACVPKVNQARCGLCETCQAGDCVTKPLGSPCSSSGQCDGEECVFPPGCDGFSTPCTSGGTCCSETCCAVLGVQYCCRGEAGQLCRSNGDCIEGTSCVAYRCRA